MKEQIIATLLSIADELLQIPGEYYLIGGSALLLMDVEIGNTTDIDLFTNRAGAKTLQRLLANYQEVNPVTKEDDLFRSDFARFRLPLMDVEVMGDLEIRKDGEWKPVLVHAYDVLSIGRLLVKVPTLKEQVRLLSLFGREKDRQRIALLKPYL